MQRDEGVLDGKSRRQQRKNAESGKGGRRRESEDTTELLCREKQTTQAKRGGNRKERRYANRARHSSGPHGAGGTRATIGQRLAFVAAFFCFSFPRLLRDDAFRPFGDLDGIVVRCGRRSHNTHTQVQWKRTQGRGVRYRESAGGPKQQNKNEGKAEGKRWPNGARERATRHNDGQGGAAEERREKGGRGYHRRGDGGMGVAGGGDGKRDRGWVIRRGGRKRRRDRPRHPLVVRSG